MNRSEIMLIVLSIIDGILLAGFAIIVVLTRKIGRKLNDLEQKCNFYSKTITKENGLSTYKEKNLSSTKTSFDYYDGTGEIVDGFSNLNNERPQIVIKSKSVYEPVQLEKPYPVRRITNKKNEGEISGYLIFDDYSMKKLKSDLDWGQLTIRNQVEQGGILIGRISL